ncbi:MAG: hypothetical protein ACOXZM_01235 [Eubacteriales bacterium]|jgi:hypothetical protein
MDHYCYFYIDDHIWLFRDLARKRPKSLFDLPYLAMLRHAHETYGLRLQLNCFFETDPSYGDDHFDLTEMPDVWQDEWRANADWLRLAFHARREFHAYPYVNATYEQVKRDYTQTTAELVRFAGQKTVSDCLTIHYLPMSRAGCMALRDCGVREISVSCGTPAAPDAPLDSLSPEDAAWLMNGRTEETSWFYASTPTGGSVITLKAYNHADTAFYRKSINTRKFWRDAETGLIFKRNCDTLVINSRSWDGCRAVLDAHRDDEYMGLAIHEQYFYEDYAAYQPDYAEKLYATARYLKDAGFRFVFLQELIELPDSMIEQE